MCDVPPQRRGDGNRTASRPVRSPTVRILTPLTASSQLIRRELHRWTATSRLNLRICLGSPLRTPVVHRHASRVLFLTVVNGRIDYDAMLPVLPRAAA